MFDSYHNHIDARLLRLTEAVVQEIDTQPNLHARMRENVGRWSTARMQTKWAKLLDLPWPQLRGRLLEKTEVGAALRQEAPLGGILATAERARIMREFNRDARTTSRAGERSRATKDRPAGINERRTAAVARRPAGPRGLSCG